jgi:hypothetical protein
MDYAGRSGTKRSGAVNIVKLPEVLKRPQYWSLGMAALHDAGLFCASPCVRARLRCVTPTEHKLTIRQRTRMLQQWPRQMKSPSRLETGWG